MKDNDRDLRSIGSIFKGLDKFINIVSDMIENEKEEVDIKGTINDLDGRPKVVGNYGFNIKLGTDKISKFRELNTLSNVDERKKRGTKNIEPVTDIFEDEDKVTIVMELPGIKEENVNYEIEENNIKINAFSENICYGKKIQLRFNLSGEEIQTKLNNSIYSIIIKKNDKR